MKVIAKSLQGDSQPSSMFTTRMPQDSCNQNNVSRLAVPGVDRSEAQGPDNSSDDDFEDDATNLANLIDGEFADNDSEEQNGASFGVGTITGVAITLAVVAAVVIAYFAYTRSIKRNAERLREVEHRQTTE